MAAAAHAASSQIAAAMLQSEDNDSQRGIGPHIWQTKQGPGLPPGPKTTYISVQLTPPHPADSARRRPTRRFACWAWGRVLQQYPEAKAWGLA